jgi:hypothetical protein
MNDKWNYVKRNSPDLFKVHYRYLPEETKEDSYSVPAETYRFNVGIKTDRHRYEYEGHL